MLRVIGVFLIFVFYSCAHESNKEIAKESEVNKNDFPIKFVRKDLFRFKGSVDSFGVYCMQNKFGRDVYIRAAIGEHPYFKYIMESNKYFKMKKEVMWAYSISDYFGKYRDSTFLKNNCFLLNELKEIITSIVLVLKYLLNF